LRAARTLTLTLAWWSEADGGWMAPGPLRSLVEAVEVFAFGGGDVRIRHDGDANLGEVVLPGEAPGESREVAFEIRVERTREVVGVRGGGEEEEEEEGIDACLVGEGEVTGARTVSVKRVLGIAAGTARREISWVGFKGPPARKQVSTFLLPGSTTFSCC
jgi:hypothetical protein